MHIPRLILKKTLDFWLPHHCAICDALSQAYFCLTCTEQFNRNSLRCFHCALPLAQIDSSICGNCLNTPPHFERSIAPFSYDSALSTAIYDFKTKGKLRGGVQLSEYLLNDIEVSHAAQGVDTLVPVPIHWRTHLSRGFNQANEIALRLSQALNIPVQLALKKTRLTPQQKTLSKKDRQSNLSQVFAAKGKIPHLGHVALIDDVMTTGCTANICAQILKSIGATQVDIWVLARTPESHL